MSFIAIADQTKTTGTRCNLPHVKRAEDVVADRTTMEPVCQCGASLAVFRSVRRKVVIHMDI
jgi:hypothetical protein